MTEKQVQKRSDFVEWRRYGNYVASVVKQGDPVESMADLPLCGVGRGDQGSVVRPVWRDEFGDFWVKVRWNKHGGVKDILCESIGILY